MLKIAFRLLAYGAAFVLALQIRHILPRGWPSWAYWGSGIVAGLALCLLIDRLCDRFFRIVDPEVRALHRTGGGRVSEQEVVNWYESAWPKVYRQGEENGLDSLSEKDRVLFLVGYVIDQLVAGGAETLYFNPSGAYAVRMADALEQIGAKRAARVMREINASFHGGAPAEDDEIRAKQMEALPAAVVRKGTRLEEIFEEELPSGGGRILLRQLYAFYHGFPERDGA